MKAYRKLAQRWHPDNFSDEKEKKAAEKKFVDIAAAKEVLFDSFHEFAKLAVQNFVALYLTFIIFKCQFALCRG